MKKMCGNPAGDWPCKQSRQGKGSSARDELPNPTPIPTLSPYFIISLIAELRGCGGKQRSYIIHCASIADTPFTVIVLHR